MTTATDLADCTAIELLQLYRRGAASPVEATQAVLARIERLQPDAQRVLPLAPEEALAAARASEARWQRRRADRPARRRAGVDQGPDPDTRLADAARQPHRRSRSSRGTSTRRPAARLREAGAVLLGKTTTPEFGCKGETNSPLTGITRNPWNPAQTPGGSSGGTAAAVAAGMGPICGRHRRRRLGAHPGRVLRQLRPQAELRPRAGVSAVALRHRRAPRPAHDERARRGADDERAQAARRARLDVAAARRAATTASALDDGVRGLRVAYSPTLGYAQDVHPEVAAAVHAAVARPRRARRASSRPSIPGFDDPLPITTGLWFAGAWTLWNTLTPEQQAVTDPDFAPRPSSARSCSDARRAAPARCSAARSAR